MKIIRLQNHTISTNEPNIDKKQYTAIIHFCEIILHLSACDKFISLYMPAVSIPWFERGMWFCHFWQIIIIDFSILNPILCYIFLPLQRGPSRQSQTFSFWRTIYSFMFSRIRTIFLSLCLKCRFQHKKKNNMKIFTSYVLWLTSHPMFYKSNEVSIAIGGRYNDMTMLIWN